MNIFDVPNMFQSAIKANIDLQNVDEEADREISYEQLEEIKSISESTKQQLAIMQKQIELVEKQLKNYEEENKNSKKQSRISMVLSIIAIASTFVASIIPKLLELLGL